MKLITSSKARTLSKSLLVLIIKEYGKIKKDMTDFHKISTLQFSCPWQRSIRVELNNQ